MFSSEKNEQRTLTLSVIIVCLAALWSTVMAVYTQSMAVGMDAAFNILSAILSSMGVVVTGFMKKGYTKKHPMGFYTYEALIALVRSLFLAGMLVVLFVDAVKLIVAGGKNVPLEAMFLYTFPSLFFCTLGYFVCHKGFQKTKTMTLEADLNEWRSSFFIAWVILGSIILTSMLRKSDYAFMSPYVDPTMVVLLCIIFIKDPIVLVGESFRHLMFQSSNSKSTDLFRDSFKELSEKNYPDLPLRNMEIVQVGRFTWVFVQLSSLHEKISLTEFRRLEKETITLAQSHFKYADAFLYFEHKNPE